jgi:hypothetical protein
MKVSSSAQANARALVHHQMKGPDLFTHFHIKPDELSASASYPRNLEASEGLKFKLKNKTLRGGNNYHILNCLPLIRMIC